MGAKHARPKCPWLKPGKLLWPGDDKWTIYTFETLKKHRELAPLYVLPLVAFSMAAFVLWHKTMRTAIEVQLDNYQRWEIPSKPRFFDLRKPRNLKLMNTHNWQPVYHLDNRYRLMRNEPMLDAEGNETDEIGEDETGWEIPTS